MSTMTQCVLQGPHQERDTRWVESRLAKIGGRLRVKATGEVWIVAEVGATWPTQRVLDYERDYVTMPTVSDAFPDPAGGRRLPVHPKG